jgi:dihydrofolate synthase/folylpolyglutamate synthase
MDFRLQRLVPVLERLGNPQDGFPSIHVAGTNGKGSTAAMLHSIYTRAGYRTALYTSPHLLSFRERIRVGHHRIAEENVVRWSGAVRDAMKHCAVELTFFEITTLMAFLEFSEQAVDVAVVEVGLGGRLDATNVVRTAAAVITSIALDHERYLGTTVTEVASEKAGILRTAAPLVTGDLPAAALSVIAKKVAEIGSPWLSFARDFGPCTFVGTDCPSGGSGLLGAHQQSNAAVAAAVTRALSEAFPVDPADVESGIRHARWPGRLEVFDAEPPRVVVDAAHNPEAASCLRAAVESLALARPRVLVFGVMADKDWREMLGRLLPAFDSVVVAAVDNPRALDPRVVHEVAGSLRPCKVAASAPEGLQLARSTAGVAGSVVVAGSIFLVAELYRLCGGAEDPFADAA